MTLSVETAVPCGLILNELAVNALKHAFNAANAGELRVELARETSGEMRMIGQRRRRRSAGGFRLAHTQSLGLQLVSMLASQVGAKVEVVSTTGAGTRFEVRLAAGGVDRPSSRTSHVTTRSAAAGEMR